MDTGSRKNAGLLFASVAMLSILGAFGASCTPAESLNTAVTSIRANSDGSFDLLRNGNPVHIRGAGGISHLQELKEAGGNTIRTWGIDDLERSINGQPFLDYVYEKGFLVVAGIWVQHERHGFDYRDPEQIQSQRDIIRAAVEKYKEHPAILLWGLGNEVEAFRPDDDDSHVWTEWNHLAEIVKEIDPNRPVMATLAGLTPRKIERFMEYGGSFDILGINAYAAAINAGEELNQSGYTGPFVLAEFGPRGHWEVGTTEWGAPLEPTANEKADYYLRTYQTVMRDAGARCLGTFVFLWGYKQETTATWYGMFLESGEKLPAVDAMTYAWTGSYPQMRCPELISAQFGAHLKTVTPGSEWSASAQAYDPNGQSINYHWSVFSEQTDPSVGGDREMAPPEHPDSIVATDSNSVTIRAPREPGAYRLFLTIRNESNAATTANFPFRVR